MAGILARIATGVGASEAARSQGSAQVKRNVIAISTALPPPVFRERHIKMDPESTDRRARIRARAYAIWEDEGRPNGKHLEHWLQAKRLVAAEGLRGAAGVLVTHPETAPPAMNDGDQ
jgi:Protein of unknown function (DUF2934)